MKYKVVVFTDEPQLGKYLPEGCKIRSYWEMPSIDALLRADDYTIIDALLARDKVVTAIKYVRSIIRDDGYGLLEAKLWMDEYRKR